MDFGNKSLAITEGKEIYLETGDKLTQTLIDHGTVSQNDNLFIHDSLYHQIPVPIKLAIVGPGSVGKSAITQRIIDNTYVEDYDPTIEDLFEKILEIDGQKINISILDTAGQEDFKGLREGQMKDKDGYIFAYSVTSKDTFDDLHSFYETLLDVLDAEDCDMKPMILCGNKVDLPKWQHVIGSSERDERERQWQASRQYLTSAKNGYNIREMIAWLVRDIKNDLYPVHKPKTEPIIATHDFICCSSCTIM